VKLSESVAVNIATSELEKESEPVDLSNATNEQEHHGFETRIERYVCTTHFLLFSNIVLVTVGSNTSL
jgi:hypothetical protein